MKRVELWGGILLLLILGTLGGLVWQVNGVSSNPHDFSDQCEACHLNVPQQRGEQLLFVYDIDYVCRYCHEDLKEQSSHPSMVFPSMKMPDGFPLDWQGRMTCATCHAPHAENWGVNRNLLRGNVEGREFCILCHSELRESQGLHLIAELTHSRKAAEPAKAGLSSELDPQSSICISCHDGSVAKAAGFSNGGDGGERLFYRGHNMSHPIGFDYAEATRYRPKYRSVESLPPEVPLIEGKVGCCSCHNIYSHQSAMLAMSNRGSALCLACHNI